MLLSLSRNSLDFMETLSSLLYAQQLDTGTYYKQNECQAPPPPFPPGLISLESIKFEFKDR
jgi:hypothetical protein